MVYKFSRIFNATVSQPKDVRRNLIDAISSITDLDPYVSQYSRNRINAGELEGYAIEIIHNPDDTFELLVTVSTDNSTIMSITLALMERTRMGFNKLD